MSAGQFRDRVDRLITLCTPHRGSRLAEVSRPLRLAIEEARKLRDSLRDSWRIVASLDTQWLADHFGSFLSNLSELRPGSAEVRQCSVDKLPVLPGGYYALAGTNPTYLPVVADLRLPPALPLPELTDGTRRHGRSGSERSRHSRSRCPADCCPARQSSEPPPATTEFTDAVLEWL